MSLIGLCSVKGSPGVTLSSLGLAGAWTGMPGSKKILIELDSFGGALAVRYQMPASPGLLSLAAQLIGPSSVDLLWKSAQQLPGGLPVILSSYQPEQVAAVLNSSSHALGSFLSQVPVDVIADFGRLSPDSPAMPIVRAVDLCLMVARPVADQLKPAAAMLKALEKTTNVGWLLIGDSPYSPADVLDAYGVQVFGTLPEDYRTAYRFESGQTMTKLRRTGLMKEFKNLAERIHSMALSPQPLPTQPGLPPFPVRPLEASE